MVRAGGIALALTALLAGCGPAVPKPRSAPPPPSQAAPAYIPPTRPVAPSVARPQAQVMQIPGVEGVIGSDAATLVRQFGQPRLDVREGDARKLQFTGPACVLDIYLYPPNGSVEPTATFVDARRASDGAEVDRAACIDALRKN